MECSKTSSKKEVYNPPWEIRKISSKQPILTPKETRKRKKEQEREKL